MRQSAGYWTKQLSITRSNTFWIAAICFWIWAPFFALGPYSLFAISDGGDASFPFIVAVTKFLELGEYWFSFEYAGVDRLAHGMMSPLDHLLFTVFDAWVAYQLEIVAQVVACLLFSYLLIVKVSETPRAVAFLGAALIAWRFVEHGNTYQMTWALVPFVLWALSCLFEDGRSAPITLAGALVLGVVFGLAAHPVFFLNSVVLLLAVWFVFVRPLSRFVHVLAVACFFLGASMALFPDIVAIVAASGESQRGAIQVPESLGALWNLVDTPIEFLLVIILFYGVVTGNILAIRGMLAALAVVAVYLVLYVGKNYFPEMVAPFSGIRLVRITYPIPYLLVFCASGVVVSFASAVHSRLGLPTKLVVPAVILIFFVSTLPSRARMIEDWVVNGNFVANYRNPVLMGLAEERARSTSPFRIATHELPAGVPVAYGLEVAGGYATQYPQRYKELWQLAMNSRPVQPINIVDVFCEPPAARTDFIVGCFDPELLGLLNVRYLVSRRNFQDDALEVVSRPEKDWSGLSVRERIASNLRANFYGRSNYYVYRLATTLPRAFVVAGARIFESRKDLDVALTTASSEDFLSQAYLLKSDIPQDLASSTAYGRGGVATVELNGNGMEVHVSAEEEEGYLLVSSSYSRFMKAFIDGQEVALFPANLALSAVAIPKGVSKVALVYVPPYSVSSLSKHVGSREEFE